MIVACPRPQRLSESRSDARFETSPVLADSVAVVKNLDENLKRDEVGDSHSLSRATEVAHQFGARRLHQKRAGSPWNF
jgi:hypothetical protein